MADNRILSYVRTYTYTNERTNERMNEQMLLVAVRLFLSLSFQNMRDQHIENWSTCACVHATSLCLFLLYCWLTWEWSNYSHCIALNHKAICQRLILLTLSLSLSRIPSWPPSMFPFTVAYKAARMKREREGILAIMAIPVIMVPKWAQIGLLRNVLLDW